MPPAPFCLPGPHDVHNAGSVKLAEATRIRLILPGLDLASSKGDAGGVTSSKQSGKAAADAAAASAKAQKKLRKLQGIASQAEQQHAGVIVDDEVLQDDEEQDEEAAAASGAEGSGKAAPGSSGSEPLDRRKGVAAGTTGAAASGRSQGRQQGPSAACRAGSSGRQLLAGSDGICQGSRIMAGGSSGDCSVGPGGGGSSSSSSASSSRRGSEDKPHIPIWERSLPTAAAEARKVAAAAVPPKVLQAVAVKTFSPTLGSLGALMAQESPSPDSVLSLSSRPPGMMRARSAIKAPGGSPTSAAAAAALKKHNTPPHAKLAAAAVALGQPTAAAGTGGAVSLGLDLPSTLRHVSFTTGASAYTPSQLLEKLILK